MTTIMKPYRDADNNNILSILVPATVVKLPTGDNITFLENSNNTQYTLATCHVAYPDDTEEQVNAVVWRNSLEKGLFSVGDEVLLRTQLEGDYAGNSVVQLPGARRVDVAKLGVDIEKFAGKEVAADA